MNLPGRLDTNNVKVSLLFLAGSIFIAFVFSLGVQADTTTSAITVSNSPPSFTIDVAESTASTQTSPTSVGDNLVFTATATDSSSEDYYLAICQTNVINPVNGSAPTCPGGSWAISTATTSGLQASASYTIQSSDEEGDLWYAFVCDGNASDAQCSESSVGIGDSGSPLFTNHAPDLNTIGNDGPGNPGAIATFTGNATAVFDTDFLSTTTSLFSSEFETSGVADWDSIVETGGAVDIVGSPVYRGSNSMYVVGNGSDNRAYATKTVSSFSAGNSYFVSFFVYVEAGDLKNNTEWRVMRFRDGTTNEMFVSFWTDGSGDVNQFTINGTGTNTGGIMLNQVDISSEFVMDSWNHVFFEYRVGDSSIGGAEAWINGVSVGDSGFNDNTTGAIGIDNFFLGNDAFAGGMISSGVVYFDAFEIAETALSADTVKLVVCETAGITGDDCDGGVGDRWCDSGYVSGLLSSTNCNTSVSNPAPAGSTDAYFYLIDEHGLVSDGAQQGGNSAYTVNNVAPIISSEQINGGSDITLTEGTITAIPNTFTVQDNNSCTDISTSNIYFYRSGESANCVNPGDQDDNLCYANISCSVVGSGNTCTGPTDATADYECIVSLQYHTDATNTGSQYPAEEWQSRIFISDGALNDTSTAASGVEVLTLIGLNVTSSIDYGTLTPGQSNDPIDQITTITNTGNVGLDTELSGNDMTGAGTIDVTYQKYGLSGLSYAAATSLTGTDTEVETNIAKTTNSGSPENTNIYWGLLIPLGTTPGSYSGSNTITGVQAELVDW